MLRITVIFLGSNDPAKVNQRIEVNPGSTVRDALVRAGVPTDNVVVNLNRAPATLNSIVNNSDSISVSMANLKGASDMVEEVPKIALTFTDIVNFGSKDSADVVNKNLVQKALAKRAEEGSKKLVDVVGGLLDEAQAEAHARNTRVAELEKSLAAAKKDVAELSYSVDQLGTGNPFSILGLLGRKDEAYDLCADLGCAVPENDSPVWATLPPKA